MPKAILLRIGNDEECDKDKVTNDVTFDLVPTQEDYEDTELIEYLKYDQIHSRVFRDKFLSDIHPKLKNKKCHLDPYFPDYYRYKAFDIPTYCDPGTIKGEFLKTLDKGDWLVFFWGIRQEKKKELYMIGHIIVEKIIDLELSTDDELVELRKKYFSAHLIRNTPTGVLVIGSKGNLLNKPLCLTEGIKKDSTNYVVKDKYAELLGINELQATSPFAKVLIHEEFVNLKKLLND